MVGLSDAPGTLPALSMTAFQVTLALLGWPREVQPYPRKELSPSMPFLLMLLLMVACLPVRWPPPDRLDLWGSITATWGGTAVLVFVVVALAWWTRVQLARDPFRREQFVRRHAAWRFYHALGLCGFFLASLYFLGWGWVAQGAMPLDDSSADSVHITASAMLGLGSLAEDPGQLPVGMELFVLAPYMVGLILSLACFYDLERALHDAQTSLPEAEPFWTRRAYLSFHLRRHLALICVPLALMVAFNNLPRVFPGGPEALKPYAVPITFGTALVIVTSLPWIVRFLWELKPLPPGPLRDRLRAACRRLGVPSIELFLWNTRNAMANAMVIGLFPVPRYVIFTDQLLNEMTPAEVEAVLGHEVGHIKHRHMLYYLLFLLMSVAMLMQFWQVSGLETLFGAKEKEHLQALPLIAMLGVYIFLVFGFLSRRCERQADLFGCRAVSCGLPHCEEHEDKLWLPPHGIGLCPTGIRTFISALEKVALLNGIHRAQPGWLQSWLHSTIALRVAFLEEVLRNPRAESRFQRRVGLVKWALIGCLLVLLFILGQQEGWAKLLTY